MRKLLYKFYWKIEKLIVPGLTSSQHFYYQKVKALLPDHCTWLDVGCGHQMFAEWMTREEKELAARARRLTGLDLEIAAMLKHGTIQDRVLANLERMPFQSESFGLVTANMVVEHLDNPASVLAEIHRVLAPGGVFIFHTTSLHSLYVRIAAGIPPGLKNKLIRFFEMRKAEDVFQTHYRLNTEECIQAQAAHAGLRLEQLEFVSNSATTVMLGPVVILELLLIRLLQYPCFRRRRTNLIAVLRKDCEVLPGA